MLSEHALLPMRRALAAALSVALLGVVGPSMASAKDDDDSRDKKEVRVYRSGDDEDGDQAPQWNQKDDDQDNDSDRDSERDNDGDDDSPQVLRYKVERADAKGGYLGVRVQDITNSMRKARDLSTDDGALVNRVEDGSPADEAGIKRGDVIIKVGDESIGDSGDLIKAMGDIDPGTKVNVVVLRDGNRRTLDVEVAKRPKDMMMVAPNFRWRSNGMDPQQMKEMSEHLRQMNPEMMRQMRMNMPGPEFRQEMDDLRKELDDLKRELRDLREEMDDSRAPSRGRRSGS